MSYFYIRGSGFKLVMASIFFCFVFLVLVVFITKFLWSHGVLTVMLRKHKGLRVQICHCLYFFLFRYLLSCVFITKYYVLMITWYPDSYFKETCFGGRKAAKQWYEFVLGRDFNIQNRLYFQVCWNHYIIYIVRSYRKTKLCFIHLSWI